MVATCASAVRLGFQVTLSSDCVQRFGEPRGATCFLWHGALGGHGRSGPSSLRFASACPTVQGRCRPLLVEATALNLWCQACIIFIQVSSLGEWAAESARADSVPREVPVRDVSLTTCRRVGPDGGACVGRPDQVLSVLGVSLFRARCARCAVVRSAAPLLSARFRSPSGKLCRHAFPDPGSPTFS